jgi:hypothetical protein
MDIEPVDAPEKWVGLRDSNPCTLIYVSLKCDEQLVP